MVTVEKLEVRSWSVRQSVFLDANSGSSAHLIACLCRSALPFHYGCSSHLAYFVVIQSWLRSWRVKVRTKHDTEDVVTA